MRDTWIGPLIGLLMMVIMIGSLFTVFYFVNKNADKKCRHKYGQEWSHIGGGYESYKCVNNDGQIRGLK